MLESIRLLFLRNANPELEKYQEEFEQHRTASNNKRCELITKVLLILNVLLIIIDFLVYRPMWDKVPSYLYLYYSHVIVLFLFFIWISLLKAKRRCNWNIGEKTFNLSLYFLVILWSTFMGLNSVKINGQVTAYIVCMFCFAAFFYTRPIEIIFTYVASLIIFSMGLILIVDNYALLYGSLVNVFITITLAILGSIMNYSNFVKDFFNKKDILESKNKIEETNQKLKEYEKLRTDFFANISHELRTPLNVIYSAKQMVDVSLKDNNFDINKVNKYLNMITQNTHRQLRLINNLIDITKIDRSSFEVKLINADIVKIVEDITLSVADYIERKGISLTFDTEVEEKVIACDPDKIERIILNLLSNSIKFTQLNGDILVKISLEEKNVCISVKDSGIGIPDNMKDLIFDRFIQVDKSINRAQEGSGIGLSLVKSLIEMQGGKVSVKSKLGEGAEFIISLPEVILPETEEVAATVDFKERHIDRINIEFSDIYR